MQHITPSRLKQFSILLSLILLAACSQAGTPAPAAPAFVTPTEAAAPAPVEPTSEAAAPATGSTPVEADPAAPPAPALSTLPSEVAGRLLPQARGLDYGYVNLAGDWVIEPQFAEALPFVEGLAAVRVEDRYGYIDSTGQMVIQPQFEAAQDFSEGLAAVMQEQQWGYIDLAGQVVIPLQFTYADRFSEGLAYVVQDEGIGYIDPAGQMIIAPRALDFARPFSDGLALIVEGGQAGYIDQTGQTVIAPQFSYADSFSEGLAVIEQEGQSGYIDPTGQIVIAPQYQYAQPFSEGLAVVVADGLAGYIDKTGQPVVPPQYAAALDFSEGLGAVLLDERWGYIDATGQTVIAPQFTFASSFANGLANVTFEDNRTAYIDPTGQIIIEVKPPEVITVETSIDLTPEQVTFTYDPALAGQVSSAIVPGETTLTPNVPFFALAPEHLTFTFEDGPAPGSLIKPQLTIYPVADFEKLSPFISEQIQILRDLLAEQPTDVPYEIPALPPANAAQMFHVQIAYLDFQGGRGIRFVTQYAQEARPVTNQEIFYTFQGLTGDGQYAVAFTYPVSTGILPATFEDSPAAADYEAFAQSLDTYMPETIQSLNGLAPGDFTPDLALLDSLVQSLTIPAGSSTGVPAESAAPVGSWVISTYIFGGVSAWGEEQANAFAGKMAEITAGSITFNGQTCQDITFASQSREAAEYLDTGYRTTPEALGLAQTSLEVITTSCAIPGFTEFIRLENGQLVINLEGVFFFLDK